LKRPEEAIASCRRAAEIYPDSVTVHNNLGLALYNLRRYEEAIVCYRRVLEIDPHNSSARSWLQYVLSNHKKNR
jgi:protein O-GlcNAc transferase